MCKSNSQRKKMGEKTEKPHKHRRTIVTIDVCIIPVCVLGMYGHRLAAKVFAPVEMPDHRDLPQHHSALRHWEAAGGSEQV